MICCKNVQPVLSFSKFQLSSFFFCFQIKLERHLSKIHGHNGVLWHGYCPTSKDILHLWSPTETPPLPHAIQHLYDIIRENWGTAWPKKPALCRQLHITFMSDT
ncbi:unnamed protein product [Eretmochelys imbricata]